MRSQKCKQQWTIICDWPCTCIFCETIQSEEIQPYIQEGVIDSVTDVNDIIDDAINFLSQNAMIDVKFGQQMVIMYFDTEKLTIWRKVKTQHVILLNHSQTNTMLRF